MEREERDALILELVGQGISQKEVGERVGLSGTRIGRILKAAGGDAPSVTRPASNGKKTYHCATPGCAAKITAEHSIYSSHTGLRYCYVGEGCWTWSDSKRRKRRIAELGDDSEALSDSREPSLQKED